MSPAKNNEELPKGHLHPITIIINDIARIFSEMGFSVESGPEVETEHYNFDVLNIPENHPARDMWDTFWLKENKIGQLLRTHTSPVQARYMEKNKPPIRIIAPGKVFRYEATDATHEAQFYQIEGLVIDKDITLAHLKGVLEIFFSKFFGKKMNIRFRPGYFPFVEPGVEVDISCFKCSPAKISKGNLGGQGQEDAALSGLRTRLETPDQRSGQGRNGRFPAEEAAALHVPRHEGPR